MENNEVLLPPGYRLYKLEGNSMIGNGKEDFNVKNRSFLEVDTYFSDEISRKISELLTKDPDSQIHVLDLAGGTESRAIGEIEKEFGDRVKAINIDIALNTEKGNEANRIQGDATHIPLVDSSIDIVYSRQLLPFILRFNREHSLQVKKVLSEVARVLKPGGIAILDDEEELSGIKSETKRRELATELGVRLESHDSFNNKRGDRNFPKFWNRGVKREEFLIMTKS
jgi:ubiquinone/menaquinone biosynthesis C-methylase UbiE